MAWTNVVNLKGPKGDSGETSGSIPNGAIVLAYNGSPEWNALKKSDEWIDVGSFTTRISKPVYDASGKPTPNDTGMGDRRLVLFAKASPEIVPETVPETVDGPGTVQAIKESFTKWPTADSGISNQ